MSALHQFRVILTVFLTVAAVLVSDLQPFNLSVVAMWTVIVLAWVALVLWRQ